MTAGAVLRRHLEPLTPLLAADGVTDLVVNRPFEVGVEAGGVWRWRAAPELDPTWLMTLAIAAAAHTRQDIDDTHPICSTVLPGGARCQIAAPPATPPDQISLTLRLPSKAPRDAQAIPDDLFQGVQARHPPRTAEDDALIALKAAGDWPGFFRRAVRLRRNILISGATGSGKTTFAKRLLRLIPPDERLITIEDARELDPPHRNVVHLLYASEGQGLSQLRPEALLRSALRMRPDRVLFQELRDGSAYHFLRAVNSGHPGSITTIHANSAALAFEQLFLLVRESEAGRDLPRDDVRALLRLLIDIVVQVARVDGAYRVTEVWHDPDGGRALRP